ADLDLGRHAELIVELSPIVRADPLAERTAGQLMRALYHAGRRGDALELYRTVSRATLATLGVEPGAELRWLHERVLNDELPAPASARPRRTPHAVPARSRRRDRPGAGTAARARRAVSLADFRAPHARAARRRPQRRPGPAAATAERALDDRGDQPFAAGQLGR